jgi:hypothetical protein
VTVLPLVAAAVFRVQPLVSPDVLEPSVLNEVEHALSRAPAGAFAPDPPPTGAVAGVSSPAADVFGTNGLNATQIAVRIVSAQGADGRWLSGTNDVSALAVRILQSVR